MVNISLCNSNSLLFHASLFPLSGYNNNATSSLAAAKTHQNKKKMLPNPNRRLTVFAAKNSSQSEDKKETVPTWANPNSEEPPPWARNEPQQTSSTFEIPFYAYLLASAVTAIAAIGSVFEYANQKPVFGVLNSDSIFYAPVLGFFVFTGIPTSAFLWFKSVQVANKEAEEQDRSDGYR